MYTGLLHTHSLIRYIILILPIIIIIKLLINRGKSIEQIDKKFVLWLMIAAHTQLLIGVLLFFTSPYVQFNSATMKNPEFRYWTVEHSTMMILSIVLFTLARVQCKKSLPDNIKYRRVLLFVAIGWVMVITTVAMSGRGIFMPA